jgi:hypothetical protein
MDKKKHHSVCNCFDHRLLVPAALVQYLYVDTDFHLLMSHDHQPILLHPDALSLRLHNANIEAPLQSLLLDVDCTCMCSWIMVLLLMYLKWFICALAFVFFWNDALAFVDSSCWWTRFIQGPASVAKVAAMINVAFSQCAGRSSIGMQPPLGQIWIEWVDLGSKCGDKCHASIA